MLRKWLALLLSLVAILSFTACGGKDAGENQTNSEEASKVKVSVTFNAMKEFAEAVGGDKVEVSTIIPDGTEPHDYEPTAQDLVGLRTAQVFIYNGLGMEAWATRLRQRTTVI